MTFDGIDELVGVVGRVVPAPELPPAQQEPHAPEHCAVA